LKDLFLQFKSTHSDWVWNTRKFTIN